MMKKVLIIDGHPNKDSLSYSLANSYLKGAQGVASEAKILRIGDLSFNPNLQYGYQKRMELEPDLLKAFDLIKWADHLVWFYPVWWGGFPAIMKGFIDRLFLPGFTYMPIKNSFRHEKLLKGKTARIITTLDQPAWFYSLIFKAPSTNQLKKCVLEFCGVNSVKVTYLGPIKSSDLVKREKWLFKMERLGEKIK